MPLTLPNTPDLILQPFANTGDKTAPPQTDPNGFVNWSIGYTPDYEIDLNSGNTSAKGIERKDQNYLFWLMTNIGQYFQQMGLASWYSTMTGGYNQGALVGRVSAGGVWQVWRSLVNANVVDPNLSNQTSWEYVPLNTELLSQVAMPAGGVADISPGGQTAELLTVSTDFNTLKLGTWEFQTDALANGSAHAPVVTGGTLAGMLEAKQWNGTGANTYNSQRYSDRNGAMFIRGALNGSWTAWAPVTLTATGVTATSYGDSTHVGVFTVNLYGQLTSASSTAISFPVTSFNTRTGAITLTSGDVTTALGYTPMISFNGRNGAVNLSSADVTGALTYTPVNKAGDTMAGALTINGGALSLQLTNTGTNGAGIRLLGDGATTPSKVIRARAGSLEIVNDAQSAIIAALTDAGGLSVPGSVTAGGIFQSSSTTCILAPTGAGAVYARPNGQASAVGELMVDQNGNVGINTNPTAVPSIGNPVLGAANIIAYNVGNIGLTLLTDNGATRTSQIGFGSAGIATFDAGMQYNNSTRALTFTAGTGGTTLTLGTGGSASLTGTGTNGAQLFLNGNGGTTPNKQIRARAGGLEFVNSANSAIVSIMDDSGNWNFSGSLTCTALNLPSDEDLKERILPAAPRPLHRLVKRPFVRFDWRDGHALNVVGTIAQDWQDVEPQYVKKWKDSNTGDTHLGVDMTAMSYEEAMWAGMEVDVLRAEVDVLRAELAALRELVAPSVN